MFRQGIFVFRFLSGGGYRRVEFSHSAIIQRAGDRFCRHRVATGGATNLRGLQAWPALARFSNLAGIERRNRRKEPTMIDINVIREKPEWVKEQIRKLQDESAVARIDTIVALDQN